MADEADAPVPGDGAFEQRMQKAELDYIATRSSNKTIAEHYVGLPL